MNRFQIFIESSLQGHEKVFSYIYSIIDAGDYGLVNYYEASRDHKVANKYKLVNKYKVVDLHKVMV